MSRLSELLGSNTRGNIVEALALSDRPLTAYRVAKTYNVNVAKVYKEMRRLESLGMVKPWTGGRGKGYRLVDDDLKRITLKLSPRVQTYLSWSSDESKRARFRAGLAQVPRLSIEGESRPGSNRRRMAGELENLAVLGRKRFDSKYLRTGRRSYDRI
jgi:hypothetical protein